MGGVGSPTACPCMPVCVTLTMVDGSGTDMSGSPVTPLHMVRITKLVTLPGPGLGEIATNREYAAAIPNKYHGWVLGSSLTAALRTAANQHMPTVSKHNNTINKTTMQQQRQQFIKPTLNVDERPLP